MSTDRHGGSELDAKTDTGPGPSPGTTAHATEPGEFDREINIRGIVGSGVALVVITLVACVVVWGLLRGIGGYDLKREAANPQQAPPEPRLEVAPSENLRLLHEEENLVLQHAGWVDERQGIVRVPIDVAIDVIAARGVSVSPAAAPTAASAAPAAPPR